MILVSALLALAVGFTGVIVSKLVQARMSNDVELRQTNFAGTLAQYTAEGGINALLYHWNTRTVAPPSFPPLQTDLPNVPQLVATYSVPGGGAILVTSDATYSLAVSTVRADNVALGVPGVYSVTADATVTNNGASTQWQTFRRRVVVEISSQSAPTGQYVITRYSR